MPHERFVTWQEAITPASEGIEQWTSAQDPSVLLRTNTPLAEADEMAVSRRKTYAKTMVDILKSIREYGRAGYVV